MGIALQIIAVVQAHWLEDHPVIAYVIGIPLILAAVVFYTLGVYVKS